MKYCREAVLFCLLALTLSVWGNAAARPGEPPRAPDSYYGEVRLLDGEPHPPASGANLVSGDKSLSKLSRQEIAALLNGNPLTLPAEIYEAAPSVEAPYAPGSIKPEVLQAALGRLNALRRIAGLGTVALDEAFTESAQYGAVLLVASEFSHTPARPANMDEAFYQRAVDATNSSNISGGTSLTLTRAVDAFMDDSDRPNIDRLGHRRWQLDPAMGKVGFGQAVAPRTREAMIAEKVFDRTPRSVDGTDYDFIAWPPSGYFPSGLFGRNQAWSVSLNESRYAIPLQSALTVTVRHDGDGQTWTFSGTETYTPTNSRPYFHVDTDNYGVRYCLIFRPEGVRAYDGTYTVSVSGLRDSAGNDIDEFSYQVTFFNAADYSRSIVSAVEASPWNTLRLTSACSDAATLAKLSGVLPRTVTVTDEDARTFSAAVRGGWTLDRANQRWTAAVDPASLPADCTDPNGLLDAVSISYGVDAQTGSFEIQSNPARFRVWCRMSDMDAVQLYRVTAAGASLRYDTNSDNYSVDNGDTIFNIGAWSADDYGEWFALCHNDNNPGLKEAYLVGVQRLGAALSGMRYYGRVSVVVGGDPGANARLCFATFDRDGKFLACAVRRISAAGTYDARPDFAGAARVSAFLFDADSRPLCAPESVEIRSN